MERPAIVGNAAGAATDTFRATVTHVAPENRWLKLFVQRNHEMMRHIEAYLEGLEPALSSKPGFMHQSQIALGTPCFARYSNNKWYRAVVSSWPRHNETLVEVTFIDYGNCEEVCVGDVRQSPDPIFRTPHGVYECFLDELDLSLITPQGAEELVLLAKSTLLSVEVTVTVRRYEQVQVNCVRPIVSVTLPDGRSLADILVRSPEFANAMAQAAAKPAFCLPDIKLGVPYRVYVAHVEEMDDVFLHLAAREPSAFSDMIQDTYTNVASLDPSLVQRDTVCLARFTEDSLLYRSLVVDCCQGNCRVAFVDYGNREVKLSSELLVIPPELLEEPVFAIHCNATSTGLDKDTFLEVTAEQELTCIFSQGVRQGVYAVTFDGLNGSKAAPAANCASYNGLPGNLPPTSASYIQIQQLRLDPGCRHVMYVTFIESTKVFYAQLKEMADDIEQISAQLAAESPSLAMLLPSDVVPGLAVACRYEGTWYRAVVVQPGPQVQVWIADYGDTTMLDISELRQLDLKYTLQPAYATKLTLDGFTCSPQSSEAMRLLLENLLLDAEANVSIINVLPDGTHAVQIFVGDPPKSVVKALNAALESSRQGCTAKAQSPTVCPVEKLIVTTVTPPQKFFGQFMKIPDGELDALQKELGDYYSASYPDPAFQPMPGDHVCCRFSEDGQFYRAKIERVLANGSQYDVFYLDYGNEETVLPQDVRSLQPQFAVAPLFGIPCQLQSGEVSEDMVDTEVEVRFLACHGDVHTVTFTTPRQSLPPRDPPAVVAPAQASAPANMNTFGGGEAPAPGLVQLLFNPGCQEQGTVVVVKSPSEFYCQLSVNDDQLNSVAEVLTSVASTQPCLPPAMRKVGTACCALYSEDGDWYRGIIRELHPGGATVFFVDYGNVESVADEGLKQLPDSLRSVPCQAVGCKLSGAVAVDAAAATARLDEILAEQEVTIRIHGHDYNKIHDVDVILPTGVNVRDQLAQEGLLQSQGGSTFPAQPPAPSMQVAPPPQMSSPQLYHVGGFNYPALTEGVAVPVEVCWVLTPGEVFVQLKETQGVLEQLMSEMQAFYASLGDTVSNDIRPGQACVALYSEDQQWYRARVVHAKAGMLGVQYVDYGNCEEVPEGSVRQGSLKKILAKYAELPAQAIRCRVRSVAPPGGLSSWPLLKDQTPLQQIFDGVFLCRPAAQKDGVHLVDLERHGGGPSLVESLVAAGLAADATAMPRELGSASEASQKQPLRAVVLPAELVFHPKQFVDVKVTAVVSLSEVWCCLVECVEPMAKALQEAGDAAPKFRNPVPGEACVARLPSKDEGAEGDAVLTPWARAVVKSRPSPAKLELFFVDVGGTRVVHHTEVKQIPPELTTQPGCAFQCVLNCSFPVDATELSAKILYKELVLQVEQQLEPAKVIGSLFDTSGDSEVNVLDSFTPPPPEEAPPPPPEESAPSLEAAPAPESSPTLHNVSAPEEAPIPEEIPTSEEQVQTSQPEVVADTVVADTAPPTVEPLAPEPEVTDSAPARGPAPARTSPPVKTSWPPMHRGPSSHTIVPCYPPLSKISGKMAAYVMHAEDLLCFYVMRKEQEQALDDLSMRLEAFYTETPKPVVKPLPKLPCVVFYPQDEAWYRAKVTGDGSCVQFVDYGNADIVPEVREIAAEFLEVPPFCYKCKLDGAKDLAGIPGVFSAFKEMIVDAELELEVMTWGPEVTVRLAKEGQDITTELKSRFLSSEPAALKTDAQQKPVVPLEGTPANEPSPASAEEREACTVSHVDGLNSFYMLYSTKLDDLADFVDKLQEVLVSAPPTVVETPNSSTLYAALYSGDNLWYRARVEGPAEEGGFKVRFVDYGNVETVKSVVSLDSEELLVEPFCIECQLADVGGAGDSSAVDKFRELVLDSDLLVETVKSEKPMTVRLFTLDGVDLLSKLPLSKRYRSTNVPLHQKALVSIMHVESPTDFFVHFNDRLDALEALTQQLQEVPECENAPADMSQPCMAYWSDELPYRVTVLEDKGEAEGAASVRVKFVDYGNTDTVERAGIRELPDALLSEPLFAINCTLDVPEGKLGQEALEKLKVLADEGPASSLLAEFLGERNGRYVVRLLDMGIDVLEKLQGAVQDASQGGSRDVTSDSPNEPVSEERTSEVPEGAPEAPVTEGADKPNDQASTDPLPDNVAVAEPLQCSELDTCQGTSEDNEVVGLTVEAESPEQEGPSDEAPDVAPENLQSSEDLPKEYTHPETECNGSSLPVGCDDVPGEPEPPCSAVGGSAELEETMLSEGANVCGAAPSAVFDDNMLPEVPEFGEEDLSAFSEETTLPEDKRAAEVFEDALSEAKCEAEVFEDALSEDNANKESKGVSHTADTSPIAGVQKGTPVKQENGITSLSTASLSDKPSALAGSGDASIAKTVSDEARQEEPLRKTDTDVSEVGLALKESDALTSQRQAGKDDCSAMGAAAIPKATVLNIGAGGDGRPAVIPNGSSSARSSPFTARRFSRRLSLDDCPIPGACTNAELLEIQSSDTVN
ncbi:tudor domain-containing 6 isoform X1 [Rhipicephalus sanguineus]|uniref:tudor domain-containing 6 isoform X1 n=1 Tax=Rhipicephalus sanguineus TaxID=34632 RepID=UPI001894FD15|nr:tudor domain-containing 6 isoform X1 [Rhipicephalus sanguineus]